METSLEFLTTSKPGREVHRHWPDEVIETCKLNAIDPLAYLTTVLAAIVSGHKQSRIGELLPWNFRPQVG